MPRVAFKRKTAICEQELLEMRERVANRSVVVCCCWVAHQRAIHVIVAALQFTVLYIHQSHQ